MNRVERLQRLRLLTLWVWMLAPAAAGAGDFPESAYREYTMGCIGNPRTSDTP